MPVKALCESAIVVLLLVGSRSCEGGVAPVDVVLEIMSAVWLVEASTCVLRLRLGWDVSESTR